MFFFGGKTFNSIENGRRECKSKQGFPISTILIFYFYWVETAKLLIKMRPKRKRNIEEVFEEAPKICFICGVSHTEIFESSNPKQKDSFSRWTNSWSAVLTEIFQLSAQNNCYEYFLQHATLCLSCLDTVREIDLALTLLKRLETSLFKWIGVFKSQIINHANRLENLQYAVDDIDLFSEQELIKWSKENGRDQMVHLLSKSKLQTPECIQ